MPKPQNATSKKVRINRVFPEDLTTNFVSSLVVQHEAEIFILSFFEVWPPPILGETDEEKLEALSAIDYIDAKCVSRLVLTPNVMREFIDTMSENLDKFERNRQTESKLGEE